MSHVAVKLIKVQSTRVITDEKKFMFNNLPVTISYYITEALEEIQAEGPSTRFSRRATVLQRSFNVVSFPCNRKWKLEHLVCIFSLFGDLWARGHEQNTHVHHQHTPCCICTGRLPGPIDRDTLLPRSSLLSKYLHIIFIVKKCSEQCIVHVYWRAIFYS